MSIEVKEYIPKNIRKIMSISEKTLKYKYGIRVLDGEFGFWVEIIEGHCIGFETENDRSRFLGGYIAGYKAALKRKK